ncbi:MAG TPA: cytochrome o ubiquinol oxidase subunit IV [Bradyrhizobium sp.]|nr:cytochrome o ubiquinol oxidase subunit IV [Bradyrhizobium sp.]
MTHSPDHSTGHSDHGHSDQGAHGSRKTYLIGFWLSVLLTAIPFYLVMSGIVQNKEATGVLLVAMAAVQIIVHMVCFLHMNSKSESGWTMMSLIFTVIIVGIVLSGSLWVMYHLNVNMMLSPDMSQMP